MLLIFFENFHRPFQKIFLNFFSLKKDNNHGFFQLHNGTKFGLTYFETSAKTFVRLACHVILHHSHMRHTYVIVLKKHFTDVAAN